MHHVRMFSMPATCAIYNAVRQSVKNGPKYGHFWQNQTNSSARVLFLQTEFFAMRRHKKKTVQGDMDGLLIPVVILTM